MNEETRCFALKHRNPDISSTDRPKPGGGTGTVYCMNRNMAQRFADRHGLPPRQKNMKIESTQRFADRDRSITPPASRTEDCNAHLHAVEDLLSDLSALIGQSDGDRRRLPMALPLLTNDQPTLLQAGQ